MRSAPSSASARRRSSAPATDTGPRVDFDLAIVGGAAYGYAGLLSNLEFWWRIGWLPVVGLPLAWYGVILWYSGNWEAPSPHSFWFSLALLQVDVLLPSVVIGVVAAVRNMSFTLI